MTNPNRSKEHKHASEQSALRSSTLKPTDQKVFGITYAVRNSTRRLMVVAALLAPAVVTGALESGCALDTQGLGLFDTVPDGGEGGTASDSGNGGGHDAMMAEDSAGFPDGFSKPDAGIDATVDAMADAETEKDAAPDALADAMFDATIDADAMADADAMMDAMVDAETMDAMTDAEVDAMPDVTMMDATTDAEVDAMVDAATDMDAGDSGVLMCGSSGTVVFDTSMPCYKEGLFRSGDFLPPPDSSPNTAACQTGSCANSPVSGDKDVLWVEETNNMGIFTTVPNPLAFRALCSSYTSAMPPTMDQMKVALALPGWFGANAANVGTSYTLSAPACGTSAVLYYIQY